MGEAKRNLFEIGDDEDPHDRLDELVRTLISEANPEHIYDLVQNICLPPSEDKFSTLEEKMIACTVVISSLISERCDQCTEDELNAGAYRAYHCAMAEILLPPWQDQLWDAGLEIFQQRNPEAVSNNAKSVAEIVERFKNATPKGTNNG